MAEKHKSNKLKARLPRGLADRGPAEIAATREMIEKIRVVYERYGFEPVETPAIEYTDALGKFLPDQDRPNEGVFSFQDDDEQWLSLRYDLTAPLARYVAERVGTENLVLPYRSYRVGWVFRNEKPGPGRFRQFMQFDADTVGSASPAADAEMCMMAADTMEALGIPRGSYVVKVWNRNIWDGLKLTLGVANDAQWLTVLRAIDKLDRLGIGGVQELLGSKRVDQSGDVTPGAGLSIPANNFITSTLTFTTVSRPRDTLIPVRELEEASSAAPPFSAAGFLQLLVEKLDGQPVPVPTLAGLEHLNEIQRLIVSAGYSDFVKIDHTVVRGLEYYTGTVFELDLTFPILGDDGQARALRLSRRRRTL